MPGPPGPNGFDGLKGRLDGNQANKAIVAITKNRVADEIPCSQEVMSTIKVKAYLL